MTLDIFDSPQLKPEGKICSEINVRMPAPVALKSTLSLAVLLPLCDVKLLSTEVLLNSSSINGGLMSSEIWDNEPFNSKMEAEIGTVISESLILLPSHFTLLLVVDNHLFSSKHNLT